ncbi:hypothetical protein BDV06DRAFT_227977 [Aspergillus oleicola]
MAPSFDEDETFPKCPSYLDWTRLCDQAEPDIQADNPQEDLIGSVHTSLPALTADTNQRSTHYGQAIPGYLYPETGSEIPSPAPALDQRTCSATSPNTSNPVATPNDLELEALAPIDSGKKRKRGKLGPERRERVKRMRNKGACLRCRIYRVQCDEGSPCGNCKNVQTALIFKQPCERVALKEVMPFRAGNSRTGNIRSTFPQYPWSPVYPQTKEIIIQHPWEGLADDRDVPLLRLPCRQFIPGTDDCLSESYESADGERMCIEFPPYACVDAEGDRMRKAMNQYLEESIGLAEKAINAEVKDKLISITLKEARRYASKRAKYSSKDPTIVANALNILAAGYISEVQPIIVGDETLGIPLVNNTKFKQHNQRLIPIAMDYQIDNLYIAYMQQNLDSVLQGLNRFIFKARKAERKETWYEIFLTIFVLLLSLELVFDKQISFVRKYREINPNIFATASYVKATMIEEWQHSAKNLIAHFRCVVRGMVPFGQQWSREMQKEANLDDEALTFVRTVGQLIDQRHGPYYRALSINTTIRTRQQNDFKLFGTILAMAPYLDEEPWPFFQTYSPKKSVTLKPSPTSWTAKDFTDDSAYTYTLSNTEINEVNEALTYFNASNFGIDEVTHFTFPLPTLGKALRDLAIELHQGKGFFVIRGLNPDDYIIEDNTIIFLGISCYVGGLLGEQTDDRKMFGHVCNPDDMDTIQENRPLKYSNRASTFHNDLYCDIIALQSRSCAETGGNHLLASASKVYEELRAAEPELASVLLKPNWPLDLRRRISQTETRPFFFHHGDHLISSVIPDALTESPDIKRQAGLASPSPVQVKALNAVQTLCKKHSVSLPMNKGDLLYVNNFSLLHAREAFMDSAANKRYLVRLWLKNWDLAWQLPGVLKRGNESVYSNENEDGEESDWNIIPERAFRFWDYERQSP